MSDPAALHQTVLLHEVVDFIAPRTGGRYLDGTLGLGGHTLGLFDACPDISVLGLDKDAQALALAQKRLAAHSGRLHAAHSPFSRFEAEMARLGWEGLDGAVLDLGVSSLQLDSPDRGFSFAEDGPLDMRMDQGGGPAPARTLVNRAKAEELKRIIGRYGEEPLAGRIARAIVNAREQGEIATTHQLAEIVARAYPPERRRQARNHPATRTFMALRIAVNREMEELEEFLERIVGSLNTGARVAIISFHSLEDRAVKQSLRWWAQACHCPPRQMVCTCGHTAKLRVLTKKPVTPSEAEMDRNPRSRSAKLRAAEKIAAGEARQ